MKQQELFSIVEKGTITEPQLLESVKKEVEKKINLNDKEFLVAVGSMRVDYIKNELTTRIKKKDFNLYSHIEKFLNSFNRSQNTISNYRNVLNNFIKFLDNRGLGFLDLDYSLCLDYFNTLNSLGLKRESQKLHKSTLSSFTTYLIFNDIIEKNYFSLIKITKKTEEKERLITKRQLEIILKAIKREDYRDAIRVMSCLGLRVSELNSFTLRGDIVEVVGKGEKTRTINLEELRGVVNVDLEAIRRVEANPVNIDCLKVTIGRISKKGVITSGFSCHSFRHFFSHSYYKNSNNNIVRLRDLLGHCSISITDRYLRDLKAY